MSDETQTMLHAVPLLALAVLYGLVSILLGISLVRERRTSWFGVGIWLLFALVATFSGLLGGLALADEDVFEGEPTWLVVGGSVAVAIPGLIMLFRGHDRSLLFAARRRVREAEQLATERGREADAISRLSATLSRTQRQPRRSGRSSTRSRRCSSPMCSCSHGSTRRPAGRSASPPAAPTRPGGRTVDRPRRRHRRGLQVARPEAIAVYDVPTAPNVNRRLAEAVAAKSAAFVPLVSEGQVAGVLVLVSRRRFVTSRIPRSTSSRASPARPRSCSSRTRSSEALRAALERESLVAEIGRRVRSELDIDTVLQVAVEETARAVGVTRCFIRLGGGEADADSRRMGRAGCRAGGRRGPNLPAMNLAARDRRTVAIADVEAAGELREDPSLGGPDTLLALGRAPRSPPRSSSSTA